MLRGASRRWYFRCEQMLKARRPGSLERKLRAAGVRTNGQSIAAASANSDSFLRFFFSFQGRVSRKDYWVRGVVLYFLFVFAAMAFAAAIGSTPIMTLVFL